MRTQIRILAAAIVLALAPVAYAETGTSPSDLNKGQNLVATKIASNFTGIAGGEDNALALVNALRTGGEVTLVTTVPPPAGSPPGTLPTTTETTFAVPTKPMGWGNVKHALSLARYQLQQAGIANPTAEQLQTALLGGDLVVTNADGTTTTTTVKGILTMRADGMGWGNIAKASGTKLGPVTSKVDMSNKSLKGTTNTSTTTTTTSTGVTTAAGGPASTVKAAKGITTAAGGNAGSMGKGPSKGITTAAGGSAGASPSGNAYGRGIVTGAGGGSTNVAATSHGKPSTAGGAGLVTGGGNSAAASGITSAGGGNNAGGNGKGQGNGKGKGG